MYIRKLLLIEAEQFFPDKLPYPDGVSGSSSFAFWLETVVFDKDKKLVDRAFDIVSGDWIITDVSGVKYPCKPDIFEMIHIKG